MFAKGSRYENLEKFQPDSEGNEDFRGVRFREIKTPPGAIEHMQEKGDRLDQLARDYYSNDRLWWRIVDANPEIVFPFEKVQTKNDLNKEKENDVEMEREEQKSHTLAQPILFIPRVKE